MTYDSPEHLAAAEGNQVLVGDNQELAEGSRPVEGNREQTIAAGDHQDLIKKRKTMIHKTTTRSRMLQIRYYQTNRWLN